MRWIAFIAVVLNVCTTWGQTFNKRYDLREVGRAQVAWNLERASNGAFLIVQGSFETDTLDSNLFFSFSTVALTRIDQNGEKAWDKRLVIPWHAVATGWANCCDSMPGGGVVIGGSKQDTLQNLSAFLIVFDAEGDTVFTRDLGIPGQQWNGFSVKRTQDGGFILVGQTDATGFLDGFAIKTDALGNEQWRRTYGQANPITDGLLTVVQLDEGEYIVGGSHFPTDFTKRWWIQRLDMQGAVVWSQYYQNFAPGNASAQLDRTSDGAILMASAWQHGTGSTQLQPYLAKVDPADGTIIWDALYGAITTRHILYAVKETPNGDLIACGVSEESGYMQGVLLRTTAQGDSLWMHKYWYQDSIYTQGTGQFYDVLPTPDGGFIATGPTYRYQPVQPNFPPGYSQDAWVVKVDADGCIVPGCNSVGIEEQATNLLEALTLFPNPASAFVTLRLELPPSVAQRPLQLSVVGMDGRIAKQQVLAGNGEHTLALHGLAAGVYHVHISSEGKWLTGGKLIIE
jgi:hypothetical protein